MSRIALASIPSLTFYKTSLTTSRRTTPIAQFVCLGNPCALYQPEAVFCRNIGGSGVGVDWKCEADLPSSLRFGKVEVSCEGWSGPGDPYVMKGSCSLEYTLVQLPNALWDADGDAAGGRRWCSWWNPFSSLSRLWQSLDTSGILFLLVWLLVLLVLAYSVVCSYWRRTYPSAAGNRRRTMPPRYPGSGSGSSPGPGPDSSRGSGFGSGFWSSGGGTGGYHNTFPGPPPPYTKDPPETQGGGGGGAPQWRPGFWTGAALGALGNHVLHNRNQNQNQNREWEWDRRDVPAPRPYDWEYEREREGMRATAGRYPSGAVGGGGVGAGSLRLGSMRTSAAYGSSRSR